MRSKITWIECGVLAFFCLATQLFAVGDKLYTVFWNGVVVHNRTELYGTTTPTMTPHVYTAHDPELPLQLQGRARVRYRNMWIRRVKLYDEGAKSISYILGE